MDKKELEKLTSYLSIIAHANGRIRLRVNPKVLTEAKDIDASRIGEFMESVEGIKSVKLNKIIGSITINYDKDIFAPTIWDDLVDGKIDDVFMSEIDNFYKGDIDAK